LGGAGAPRGPEVIARHDGGRPPIPPAQGCHDGGRPPMHPASGDPLPAADIAPPDEDELLVVVGPTASGKTELAVRLAQRPRGSPSGWAARSWAPTACRSTGASTPDRASPPPRSSGARLTTWSTSPTRSSPSTPSASSSRPTGPSPTSVGVTRSRSCAAAPTCG